MSNSQMTNAYYPAIFHKEKKGYWVEFPDLPGCLTEGRTIDITKSMAEDCLYNWLECTKDVAQPSQIDAINVTGEDVVMLIEPKPFFKE